MLRLGLRLFAFPSGRTPLAPAAFSPARTSRRRAGSAPGRALDRVPAPPEIPSPLHQSVRAARTHNPFPRGLRECRRLPSLRLLALQRRVPEREARARVWSGASGNAPIAFEDAAWAQ